MVEHTKAPWKAETIHSYTNGEPVEISIMSSDEEIALIDLEGEDEAMARANAAFICKAVNHHEAWAKGLQLIADIAEGSETVNSLLHIAKIARQLLSDAE